MSSVENFIQSAKRLGVFDDDSGIIFFILP